MAKRLDLDEQAQAILYAAVHGDEAAERKFKVSDRTLRNYREKAREEGSELSAIFRRYAEAVSPGQQRAVTFGAWLTGHVQEVAAVMLEKARLADPRNPLSLQAINAHVATLLEHHAALAYIDSLFPGTRPPSDEPDDQEAAAARQGHPPTWGTAPTAAA